MCYNLVGQLVIKKVQKIKYLSMILTHQYIYPYFSFKESNAAGKFCKS
jgi:hypothetical protein